MVQDWLLRVSDGVHFKNSSTKHLWGVDSKYGDRRCFIRDVREGDRLWFVKAKSNGLLLAVATYTHTKARELGPLISFTLTNEELGWTKQDGDWDTEIHFKDLYNITSLNLLSHIQSPLVIRTYNPEKCKVPLPEEYANIVKYSRVSSQM